MKFSLTNLLPFIWCNSQTKLSLTYFSWQWITLWFEFFFFVSFLFYLDFFVDVFVIRRVLLQFNKCSLTWDTYIMIARDSKILWSDFTKRYCIKFQWCTDLASNLRQKEKQTRFKQANHINKCAWQIGSMACDWWRAWNWIKLSALLCTLAFDRWAPEIGLNFICHLHERAKEVLESEREWEARKPQLAQTHAKWHNMIHNMIHKMTQYRK